MNEQLTPEERALELKRLIEQLQPVHKAVYLLFLVHPEGIEFKRLADYREELTRYYMATAKIMDKEKVMNG